MAFKVGKALDHVWKGKSNEAANAFSTNVDINKNMGSRIFSDQAFGGQQKMEGVMQSIDKHRNPWKYDDARRAQAQAHDAAIKDYDQGLKDGNMTDEMKTLIRKGREEEMSALDAIKARGKGDPGLFSTAAEVGKGTIGAMNAGTAGQVAAKWGAAIGAGAVINGTGRAMTGGGVTYNGSGQRDIMGVPFV